MFGQSFVDRSVAWLSTQSSIFTIFFSSAHVHVPAFFSNSFFFYCALVTHNERFGHTSAAPASCEWKAVQRFAPLPVRQIMGRLCVHILTAFCRGVRTWYSLLHCNAFILKYLHYMDETCYNMDHW